jgi:hypothetical protein
MGINSCERGLCLENGEYNTISHILSGAEMLSILCLGLLAAMLSWGLWMKAKAKFTLPASPWWPNAEDPSLAIELADSPAVADRSSWRGKHRRWRR